MGLLECASSASIWRGYDYYKEKKVKKLLAVDESQYIAEVDGTRANPYKVLIDVAHPRKSKCNCPHADGTRIICKHMIAVYFTAFPAEAQRIYDEAIAYEEQEEQRQEELTDRVIRYVEKMKKADLCQALLELLFDGPEWQYNRFVSEHDLDNYDDYYN